MAILPFSREDDPNKDLPFGEKIMLKCRQQPLVPAGCLLTVGALYLSARATKAGNRRLANRMFFWRVAFQGFTVAALVVGAYMMGFPQSTRDRDAELRAKAKEREKMWIEELERIDAENKARSLLNKNKPVEPKKDPWFKSKGGSDEQN